MTQSDAQLVPEIGRYAVIRRLGEGAMGRVYLAHDPVLDRHVAIKVLRDDLGLSSEHRDALFERMRQEARASARVSHPYIVTLHDMGEDPNVGLFLVFEYVDGPTLKARIARGLVGPTDCAQLARELGQALAFAHEAGVLHRDIKPDNVILARTGAKIADFGIARVPDSTLTRDGRLLGTPAYSAPEAIASGRFSPASDQFSLAATLYEAISLHRAFPGDDALAVAARITSEEPPRIAEVCHLDPQVDQVLARGLSKNPKARFDTAAEFGQALSTALLLGTPGLTTPSHLAPAARPVETTPRVLRIALGAATLGALLTVATVQLSRGCSSAAPVDSADSGVTLPALPSAGSPPPRGVPRKRPTAASPSPSEAAKKSDAEPTPGVGGSPNHSQK